MKVHTYYSAILLICESTVGVFCKQPHILFILADDFGWNDIGYHGSEIETPTLDALAAEGVKLENYYVQQVCTPTRSQLMTGRYQIHTGLQHKIICPSCPFALPKEIPTLADKLREVGYSTHIVGKWHLGFYQPKYLPNNRGFDTFDGLDFHHNFEPVLDKNGSYSANIFAEKVQELVEHHVSSESNKAQYNPTKSGKPGKYHKNLGFVSAINIGRTTEKPLFIYVPFQSVHGPLEVPQEYMNKYPASLEEKRRQYAGMVSAMDEAVKNITESFKANGLWEETLLIFSTDNGGLPSNGGNNYPLKGGKNTLWEGGIRGVAFLHGTQLENPNRVTHQLLHVSDWFPTILKLAGGDISSLSLDGYDVSSTISKESPSPRKEILHSIDPLSEPLGQRSYSKIFDTRMQTAIRVGEWKLLTGNPGLFRDGHYRTDGEDIIIEESMSDFEEENDRNVWLYNIKNDPYEYINLSDEYPSVVTWLLKRLSHYNSTAVPCVYKHGDSNADPSKHGDLWCPWQEDT